MRHLYLYLTIATLGLVIYHVGQKIIPSGGNPMVTLMGIYAAAFLLCALSAPFFRVADGVGWREAVFSWPVLVVALGAFLIEFGFLMAYRRGGPLQWSSAAVNAAGAMLLIPLAVLFFREQLSPTKMLGVLFSLTGLGLLSWK